MMTSQQVSWWAVHTFVQSYLDSAGDYPPAGSPAWYELPSNDRRKWAALLDYAQHHALRVETAQEELSVASKAIAGETDWAAVARHIRDRDEFYATKPWMRRVSA